MHTGRNGYGSLKVIAGCMSSMKTGLLVIELDRVQRASSARRGEFKIRPVAFKSAKDTRSPPGCIASRIDGLKFPAIEVVTSACILEQLPPEASFVGIDEPQFFGMDLIPVVQELLKRGIDVVAAGLDLDFKKDPYPVMANMTGIAEEVVKVSAICVVCGKKATYSQRLFYGKPASRHSPVELVDGAEAGVDYEARCGCCHELPD